MQLTSIALAIDRQACRGVGASGPHRYWRVYVQTVHSATYPLIAEVQFRATVGGANVATGGTAIALDSQAGNTPDKAFDGLDWTQWEGVTNAPNWIGYDFGGTPREIAEVLLQATGFPNNMPSAFQVQYSDDSVAWTTAWSETGIAAWTTSEIRLFTA